MDPQLSPEWKKVIAELIKLGPKIAHGDIRIVIVAGKPALTEVLIKKKAGEETTPDDDFIVKALL